MNKIIVWFRQDFRLLDNPALSDAVNSGAILPIFIHDTNTPKDLAIGSASKLWLYYTLNSFNHSIAGNLQIYSGNPLTILTNLTKQYNITQINWNRCYNKYQIEMDHEIESSLNNQGIKIKTFNGSLLWEPCEIIKADGTPYKVFTPYYRRGCLNASPPRTPLAKPTRINYISTKSKTAIKDKDLKLIASTMLSANWATNIIKGWDVSENGAHIALNNFIQHKLNNYKTARNIPSLNGTSRLSPYLSFGQISPNVIWHKLHALEFNDNIDTYCSELGWREFSYYLLYYFPNLY